MLLSVILLFFQLWGNVEVSSSQIKCLTLPDVPHANISEETKIIEYQGGHVINFTCEPGYTTSGPTIRYVCTSEGWLAVQQESCSPRSCGHPGDGQFADFFLEKGDDFVFGSQVAYTCNKGYQMVSRTNYRRCMAEGWDGVVPVCEAQQCPVIHVADNVQVIGDPEEATYGNVVQFSCKRRSEILSGPQEMYCDENGEWRGQVPTCKAITCAAPNIENGDVPENIPEYKEDEVLHYICNPKYKHTGRPSTCIKLGMRAEWSPTPACEPITCRLSLLPSEGTISLHPSKNLFSPGETVRVNCGNKHWVSNNWKTSAVSTCKEDGEWSIQPVCQAVVCGYQRPQHVDDWNVAWRQRTPLGGTATYTCVRGYKKIDGITSATCTRDGWNPSPLCEEITCNSPYYQDADIVGEVKYTYKYNDKVKYNCKAGYEGSFTVTCEGRGWTSRFRTPPCIRTPCKKLHIDNAQITYNKKENYKLSEAVEYTCRNDATRVFTVTCEQGGVWTGIQNCSECPEAVVRDGFARSFNDSLYYTCNRGFKLPTKGWWAEAKCNDGRWFGLKHCIENTMCGDIPEIPNGKATHDSRLSSQKAWIACDKGYHKQVSSITCSKGSWFSKGVSPKTICTRLAVPCDPPRKVDNAVVETPYQKEYLSDSAVTYRCRDRFTMSEGEGTIRCNEGQWEEKNITCTPSIQHLSDARDVRGPKESQ